jgi:hypothetical protein
MIIGINGKIGSGKDTVGKIIQYLTAEDVGADCLKRIRAGLSIDGHHNSSFENKKFAGKLKQIASLLTGIPVEKFEDQDFKQSYMGEQWAKTPIAPLSEATLFDAVDLNNLMTYREFLQKLGTEAMRDGLHTNVWVNALFADYKYEIHRSEVPTRAAGFIDQHVYPNWIITDMRFPNEMEAVKERNGITIRVSRTGIHTPKIEDLHPSETALDDCEFDYYIDNSGTIEDLIEKVREILINEKLL